MQIGCGLELETVRAGEIVRWFDPMYFVEQRKKINTTLRRTTGRIREELLCLFPIPLIAETPLNYLSKEAVIVIFRMSNGLHYMSVVTRIESGRLEEAVAGYRSNGIVSLNRSICSGFFKGLTARISVTSSRYNSGWGQWNWICLSETIESNGA